MKDQLQPLITHIQRFVDINSSEIEIIQTYFDFKPVRNKEHLLLEGDHCREKYFISKGCLRKYVNNENGDKQIIQFSIENWWMTDYTSLESGRPATCNIQAVEDCELIFITKDKLEQLYKRVPLVETYFRKILQRAFEASLTRIQLIFSYSGEERYRSFTRAFPEFVQRIPQYMLASYLGFTPEFLSKLRSKKS
jgi:CRP/FNR family transcriptional regulator, anaerobic regulatory protein